MGRRLAILLVLLASSLAGAPRAQPVPAWDDELHISLIVHELVHEEITQVCLMMTPHEFGVRAWRHDAREGHRDMVERILSGRFRPEEHPW